MSYFKMTLFDNPIWLTISQLTCTKTKRKTKAFSMIGNASNAVTDSGTFINITAEILC